VATGTEADIRAALASGTGKAKVAKNMGVGVSTVMRVHREMTAD
jgi:transposase